MTKADYFSEKDETYFTSPSTTAASTGTSQLPAAVPAETVIQPNPIEEALKAYTQSSHKLVIKRYAIKRG